MTVFDDTKTWWFNADEHGATGRTGSLPARLVRREPAEDRHDDHGQETQGKRPHGEVGTQEVAETDARQDDGRGQPRPISFGGLAERQPTGGGTQGGADSRIVALLPEAPDCPDGERRDRTAGRPAEPRAERPALVALVRRLRGPSSVRAVTVTRSPAAEARAAHDERRGATHARAVGVRSTCVNA